MAGRQVAHAEVSIGVDTDRLEAELDAARSKFQRTLGAIDRMEAEAKASLSTVELDREIAEANAKLKQLDSAEARAQLGIDDAEFERQYLATKAKIKELGRKKAEVAVGVKEIKHAHAELARLQKRLEAMEKAQRDLNKAQDAHNQRVRQHIKTYQDALDYENRWYAAEQKHYRDRSVMQQQALDMDRRRRDEIDRTAQAELKRYQDALDYENRWYAAEQKHYRDRAVMQQQALDMDRQRTVELAKQRERYSHLLAQQQKITFDIGGDSDANALKRDRLNAELELTRHRITSLGGSYDNLRAHEEDGITRWKKMVRSLGAVRLQMGPISATLRQTAIGFTALGPVIFAVIGQLASLIGVLGTGLMGALAVSTAGVMGFGLSALGAGLLLKPLISELTNARSATQKYDDAVEQYGKGSQQAAAAQKEMNAALRKVGPDGREALKSMSSIGQQWTKLTSSKARPVFFDTLNSGLKAVQRVLPTFAQQSVATFRTLGDETKRWTSMMSSGEAVAGIRTIMSTFRSALPAISGGFRNLFTGLSRVGVAASRFLPELMQGFELWTGRFTGADIGAKIARLVEHMQQLGKFTQSAGSMLAAFFNAGANEGAGLLSTLTSIFDRWTSWMNSAGGQNALANFFREANSLGSSFFSTVTSMGVALFELSQALAPLSAGFVAAIRGVSQLVAAFMGLAPIRGVVTALGGAIAGAFVAGKLVAFRTAILGIVAAIRTLVTTGALVSTLASLSNPFTALAMVVGAGAAALSLLKSGADDVTSSLSATANAARTVESAIATMAGTDIEAARAGLELRAATAAKKTAQDAYNRAVAEHGAKSPQALAAERALTEATLRRQSAVQGISTALSQSRKTYRDAAASAQDGMTKASTALTGYEARIEGWKAKVDKAGLGDLWGKSVAKNRSLIQQTSAEGDKYIETLREIKAEERRLSSNREKLADLNARQAQSELNLARAAKGLAPVLGKVGAAWHDLRYSMGFLENGGKIQKAFENMSGDPKQVADAIKLTESLNKMGKLPQAGKIILNSDSIDEAIAKLKKLNVQSRTVVKATANTDQAKRDIGKLGKGKTATVNVKANTKNADKPLAKLSGKRIAAMLTIRANDRDAVSKLNKIERKQLTRKLLKLGASPQAVLAAIDIINNKKIPAKLAKFKADTGNAETGNKKVQGFKDKKVNLDIGIGIDQTAQARMNIASVQGKTVYVDVVTRNRTGKAQGGIVGATGFAKGGESPARTKSVMRPSEYAAAPKRMPHSTKLTNASAERASVRQNRPGVYKRPTLLVGEENRTEYVIASNPSYRSQNERYLSAAADEFGFSLVKAAKGGKAPPKKNPSSTSVGTGTNKYIASLQNRYDYYRGEISRLTGLSSQRRSDQDLDIRAGKQTGYKYGPLLDPLNEAQTVYSKLEAHIGKMLRAEQKSVGRSRRIDRNITPKKLQKDKKAVNAAKKNLKSFRKKHPKNDKGIRKREKDLQTAQKQYDAHKRKDKEARENVVSRQGNIAQLWRELRQDIPGEKAGLEATIRELQYMKDGLLTEDSSGGSSTPMGIQMGQYDSARYDMFKDFGSNISPLSGAGASGGSPFLPGGGAGAPSGNMPTGPSFYRASAPGGSSPASGSAPAAGGSGGTTVTQNITISEPPPDPHSFSQQLGWEAGLVG